MERTILNKTPNYDYIISVYKKLILQSKIPVSSYLGDCSEKGMYFDYKGVAELFKYNFDVIPSRCEPIIRMMKQYLKTKSLKGLSILDMCCGFGAMLVYIYLKEMLHIATGIDSNYLRINIFNKIIKKCPNLHLNAICGDVNELPFYCNNFDIIMIIDSFHYANMDRKRILAQVYEILKPSGIFFIKVVNRIYPKQFFGLYGINYLLRRFNLKYANYRVILSTYLNQNVPSPFLVKRMMRNMGLKNIMICTPRGKQGIEAYLHSHFIAMGQK